MNARAFVSSPYQRCPEGGSMSAFSAIASGAVAPAAQGQLPSSGANAPAVADTIAAAIASVRRVPATSCTRKMRAPCPYASAVVMCVSRSRPSGPAPETLPM